MDLMEQLYGCDTAEISDALDACGIEGACLGIKPINSKGIRLVGPAYTVQYRSHDERYPKFESSSNYLDNVLADAVVVIDNEGRLDCTVWGDISTQVALMRNIAGTVIFGAARDVRFIRETDYPVFASGIYMRSGNGRVYHTGEQCEINIHNVKIKPGDIIVGDENGLVVIPSERLKEVLDVAYKIKTTEQAMIVSIKSGMKFAEVKKQYHYDKPWLKSKK